ncbi:hypothetical protein WMY93_012840 [Mugilogobius chulae]|uniref:Uncharacterized protein n=1 Tax=Mugilogobius chulae TaxID=88201 RepID=A0AAW0P4E2_9GOBI
MLCSDMLVTKRFSAAGYGRAGPAISASVGETVDLSFNPGECLRSRTWAIVTPGEHPAVLDVFACRNNVSLPSSDRVKAQCPAEEGQNIILQIFPVELSDSGKYCLEYKGKTCSCVHLVVQNISSDDQTIKTKGKIQT